MPVPPPARASPNNTTASGSTARPSSRYRGRQPQIRYAPTTSQTKRLSEAAHVDHGNPSARAACTASSAVGRSQPMRTPHVAKRPARPGRRASPKYATAASPYASSAGQNKSSANCHRLPLGLVAVAQRELRELREFALEPLQLQSDDEDVGEQHDEHDEVRSCDVLLLGRHCNASRSSRRRMSSRFPASSTWYRVAATANMAATATQNVKTCEAAMFGPFSSNATGWMKRSDNRIARMLTGMSATPKSA